MERTNAEVTRQTRRQPMQVCRDGRERIFDPEDKAAGEERRGRHSRMKVRRRESEEQAGGMKPDHRPRHVSLFRSGPTSYQSLPPGRTTNLCLGGSSGDGRRLRAANTHPQQTP